MYKSILFLGVLLLMAPAFGQQILNVPDRFTALDLKYAKPLIESGLGFVVKIFTKDKIIHQAAYGMSNLKTKRLNGVDTNFNLASNTKQFTAGLALLLEQDGKLLPKDPVSKYIPEFAPQFAKVTVEQLIHHTSGLPEYWELCDGKTKVKNRDILEFLAKKQLEFEPGSRFSYSNSGYVVLSEIVQRLSGRSFPEVMIDRIFKPLGMTDSIVHDENSENHILRRAIGYSGAPEFEEDDVSVCNYNYGDSSVYSSLNDYSKWLLALSSDVLFLPEFKAKIFAKSITNLGKSNGYGYGWGVYKYRDGTPMYEHAGSWQGFRSIATFLPTRGIWLVALSNCGDFKEAEIVESYLDAAIALEDDHQ